MADIIKGIVSLTKYEQDPPKFPCVFIPTTSYGNDEWFYKFEKAFVTDQKIRTSGDYFEMRIIEIIGEAKP